ncbi:APC family permease [Acidocella sp. KAb 2-4]|uniref:APC family permease n=1 Tax=Acidocella sp. KAb 2-4 TaxID=2885158 RepID=UPI001D083737|nr:APC family permease [Acidocella sp. KAb 2-4]MCB5945522.1 APC family permease [Acidocella sp. KAb 2-4]
MVATTDVAAHTAPQLKRGALSRLETLGQSIANIAPTMTPALNITVVAGLAGISSWVSYLLATIGCVFVGASISSLAKRHPEAGSYFVYIGRNFGPVAGALAGWAMVLAYIATAVAVLISEPLFINNVLGVFGVTLPYAAQVFLAFALLALVVLAGYRDIQFSSRMGLVLEAVSIGIIVLITALVVGKHGTVIDPVQLNFSKISFGGVASAMAFAVFSWVGFESSATLAKESANPQKNIPYAVVGSAAIVGIFFTIMSYLMVMGMDDNAAAIGGSASPFADMTNKAGLPWAAGVVYFAAIISAFACALACLNASSRMLFSMGRYQFLHGSMGLVHKRHKTPHMAVYASGVIAGLAMLALLPEGFLNGFGLAGTIATYGFVVVYFGVCLAAPLDLYRAGALKPTHALYGLIGTLMMGFVIYSSVFPYPAAPFNVLPPVFAAYLAVGLVWFLVLKVKSPQVLRSIATDMEG